MRVKILKDGYNEIIFKPSTKRVVIGINVMSHFGARYKSFKAKTEDEAKTVGMDYLNKHSKVKP